MNADEIARACGEKLWEDDQVRRLLGLEFVEIVPGGATISMEVRRDMLNSHGTCHGGVIFTLADSAFAYACNSRDATTLAQTCSVTFLVAGQLGDVLTAEAREVSRAGRSGVYDVTVTRQDGVVVAEFRGVTRTVRGAVLDDARTKAKVDG